MELQKIGTAAPASETVFFVEDQITFPFEKHAYAVREVTRESAVQLGEINRRIAEANEQAGKKELRTARRDLCAASLQSLYASYNAIIRNSARRHVVAGEPYPIGGIIEKSLARVVTFKERVRV